MRMTDMTAEQNSLWENSIVKIHVEGKNIEKEDEKKNC